MKPPESEILALGLQNDIGEQHRCVGGVEERPDSTLNSSPASMQKILHGRDFPSNDLEENNKTTLTFLTKWGIAAPAEVPLAGEGVAPHDVIAGVTLVGDSGSPHELRMRSGFPTVLDLGQI